MQYLGDDDQIYFLGDSIDRGESAIPIAEALLNDTRITYLLGNHEHMMWHAILEIGNYYEDPYRSWMLNGGGATLASANKEWMGIDIERHLKNLAYRFAELPFCASCINENGFEIYMSHSGYETNPKISYYNWEFAIWNRSHFLAKPSEDRIVVHGHTPVPILIDTLRYADAIDKDVTVEPGMLQYCYGNKFDIDCGTPFTGVCSLLNLDNFEETVFFKDDSSYDKWAEVMNSAQK